MNNVKRIIAAGLVGTAVISTGVVASAEEVTYKDAALKALKDAGVPDNYAADAVSACEKIVVDDAQAATLQNAITEALGAYNKYGKDGISKNQDGVQDHLQDIQKDIEHDLNLTIKATTTDGIKINKYKGESLLVWSVDDIKKINSVADKNKLTSDDTINTVMDFAKQTDKNAVKPGQDPTPDPTPDPKPDPKPDKPATETPDTPFTPGDSTTTQEYVDAVNKLEAGKDWTDEQVKALEDIKKLVTDMLENGFTLDQLNQAEALLAKLPADSEQYKTLKATIDYLKTYQNNNGQTAGDAQVEATKTPSNNNNNGSATSGSTAKTATNFGNVAVAGLGLMTVAGTVFVISKKKIQ